MSFESYLTLISFYKRSFFLFYAFVSLKKTWRGLEKRAYNCYEMMRRSFGETNCCWGVKVKVTWQLGEEGVKDRWARWGRWKGKMRWKEIEDFEGLFGLLFLLEHARWYWNKVETCSIQTRFFKGLRKETTQHIKQIINNLSLKVFDILSKNMIISLFIYHTYHSCSTNLVKIIKFFEKKKVQ